MSANNVIFIKVKTKEVFYQGCYDNDMVNAKKIGQAKTLEGAYKLANKYFDTELPYLEYGVQLI